MSVRYRDKEVEVYKNISFIYIYMCNEVSGAEQYVFTTE